MVNILWSQRPGVLLVLLPLALVGCVTQGEYLQVAHERDQLRGSVKTLEQTVEKEKETGESLSLQLLSVRSERSASTRERSRLQSSMEELARRKSESDARVSEYRSLVEKFKPLVEAGRVRVRIVEGRTVVVLPSDPLFAPGTASLSGEGKLAVAEVSGVLASIPNGRFQIAAHTDNVPAKNGPASSAWDLTSARSLSVLKTMLDCGMPPDHVSTASFGDSKPAALNRRIEISVVPDPSTLPGFEELSRVGA